MKEYDEATLKKVQQTEMEILRDFIKVCDENNLTWFGDAGSGIGAIRHKGFIPWDDDIDMMMFRDDYEKLCKVAQEEFEYPYFFQTEYTDVGSLRGHTQLSR
jgi:lipopolysaccharide cholinephosphotransferase